MLKGSRHACQLAGCMYVQILSCEEIKASTLSATLLEWEYGAQDGTVKHPMHSVDFQSAFDLEAQGLVACKLHYNP